MSAAWAKIHEDLNKSAFYLRVKQRAPLWQRMLKGGMFLAVIFISLDAACTSALWLSFF